MERPKDWEGLPTMALFRPWAACIAESLALGPAHASARRIYLPTFSLAVPPGRWVVFTEHSLCQPRA